MQRWLFQLSGKPLSSRCLLFGKAPRSTLFVVGKQFAVAESILTSSCCLALARVSRRSSLCWDKGTHASAFAYPVPMHILFTQHRLA